jgi:hypothetical protein
MKIGRKLLVVRLFYPAYTPDQVRPRQNQAFQKVGECLYRYSPNGVYYARFERGSKEVRRSLRTTDRASAQRALAWLKQEREQIDPAHGKLTISELCDRYSATIQHQKPKTIERKALINRRIKCLRSRTAFFGHGKTSTFSLTRYQSGRMTRLPPTLFSLGGPRRQSLAAAAATFLRLVIH